MNRADAIRNLGRVIAKEVKETTKQVIRNGAYYSYCGGCGKYIGGRTEEGFGGELIVLFNCACGRHEQKKALECEFKSLIWSPAK